MNFQRFLPSASSNHVSNPEELETRNDRSRELIRLVLFFSQFDSTPMQGDLSDAKRAASPVRVKNILSKPFQLAPFFCHWELNISQLVSGINEGLCCRFWFIKESSQKPVYISKKGGDFRGSDVSGVPENVIDKWAFETRFVATNKRYCLRLFKYGSFLKWL